MSTQLTPEQALISLVAALNSTHWSSWQTTATFAPALAAAEDVLSMQRIRYAAPDLLKELRLLNLDQNGEQKHNTPAWLAIRQATGEAT